MDSLLRNLTVVVVSQAGFPVDGSKERQGWGFGTEASAFAAGVKSAMNNDGWIMLWAVPQRQS
jgi:hypothetical protein